MMAQPWIDVSVRLGTGMVNWPGVRATHGRHWFKAGEVLARADRKWLGGLITRREKPEDFKQALERRPDDIKVVVQFSEI